MISSKVWAYTALCWLLAMPLAQSQNTEISAPVNPKWAFGLRGGAGFNTSHLKTQFRTVSPGYILIDRPFQTRPGNNSSLEYYVGAYATRFLSPRWSLRSELTVMLNPYNSLAVGVGLFPRYRLNRWLSLEAGLEAKQVLTGYQRNESKLWIGTALNWKNMEFNLRYSPGYSHASPFSRGGLTNSIQAGVSFNLSKAGKKIGGN